MSATGPYESKRYGIVGQEREVVRFNVSQRLEHLVLMVSFTMLVFTGIPQKFYDVPAMEGIIGLLGGIDNTRFVHRFFAIVMVLESVYHIGYLAFSFAVGRGRLSMLPIPKDVRDLFGMIAYYVGKRKEPPLFDRYDYRQKFEYWGVVWGTAVMVVTGLMMVYPTWTTRILPGQFIPAARAAHGGEALLAFLVIVIWHLYNTHLSPGRFPLDKVIFTGKLPEHKMIEEHPLEYARMLEAQQKAIEAQQKAKEKQQETRQAEG